MLADVSTVSISVLVLAQPSNWPVVSNIKKPALVNQRGFFNAVNLSASGFHNLDKCGRAT